MKIALFIKDDKSIAIPQPLHYSSYQKPCDKGNYNAHAGYEDKNDEEVYPMMYMEKILTHAESKGLMELISFVFARELSKDNEP